MKRNEIAKTEKTVVIFRVWKQGGDVLALFPQLAEGRGLCSSYQHVGQHGSADYEHCIAATRPATAAKFASLARELRLLGYNLKIARRLPSRR